MRLLVLFGAWALSGCTVLGLAIGGAVTKPAETNDSLSFEACLEQRRAIGETARATAAPMERARMLDPLPVCESKMPERQTYAGTGAVVGLVVDVAVIASVVYLFATVPSE